MFRLGLLTLAFLVVFSQQDDLQDFMEKTKEEYKILGMTIGAFKANEWIMKGTVGVRNADDPTPIGENDKFNLGDAGRSITAMLAARIIEQSEGMITWQSTIAEVFGDSINVQSPFRDSTLLDLLVHNGRILDQEQVLQKDDIIDWYDKVWAASQWSMPEENKQQRLDLTQYLVNVECGGEEDMCKKGTYSKFTYSVAVAMLEMFTGKTFDILLKEEVFGPLNASNCGLGPNTLDQSLPPAQPWSHFSGPWGVYNIPILPGNQTNMPSSMAPDVGIHCSMESWRNFLSAHLTRDESYLSKENWDLLQTEQVKLEVGYFQYMRYAPGFIVDMEDGIPYLREFSAGDKNYARCYVIPDADIGIILAVNSNMQGGMIQMAGLQKILDYVVRQLFPPSVSFNVENFKTPQFLI
eukprot:GFUD01038512.1.p1 GENE.GFUD01038512.1~~GFUD01038512.1.p1  ORF type:complete len:409 (+),score=97.94 GFUD01038512.1:3-1229(+)